jgi:hypothetical protein
MGARQWKCGRGRGFKHRHVLTQMNPVPLHRCWTEPGWAKRQTRRHVISLRSLDATASEKRTHCFSAVYCARCRSTLFRSICWLRGVVPQYLERRNGLHMSCIGMDCVPSIRQNPTELETRRRRHFVYVCSPLYETRLEQGHVSILRLP